MLLAILIVLLIFFSMMGMEVAWSIGIASLAYIVLSQFEDYPIRFVLMAHKMVDGIDAFAYLAIPLFIFAGDMMNAAGITRRLIRVAAAMVGHLYGGLANVGVVANYIMSGISGSAIADAAATGTVLLPEMKKRGFPPDFSSAVIACSATVGPIIPPSIIFVVLGALMEISVGRLFLGGVLPGTVMLIAMFILTWWISRKRNYPREPRATFRERRIAIWDGILSLAAPLVIIGALVLGIATPTEAAAVAVFYTVLLGFFVYRSLTVQHVFRAAGRTAIASAVIMLTVSTSGVFADISVQERLGELLTRGMLAISDNVYVLLFITNIVLLVLGTFMEVLPIMLILAPILFPLFGGLGIDPVHLGLIFVLNLTLGMITPPVGLNLFVISAIGGVDQIRIFKAAIPYLAILVGVLILLTYVPWITMYLPNLLIPSK